MDHDDITGQYRSAGYSHPQPREEKKLVLEFQAPDSPRSRSTSPIKVFNQTSMTIEKQSTLFGENSPHLQAAIDAFDD